MRRLGGEAVLIPVSGMMNLRRMYSLNRSAALLWERFADEEFTSENISSVLSDTYGITTSEADTDTEKFIREFSELGLIAL